MTPSTYRSSLSLPLFDAAVAASSSLAESVRLSLAALVDAARTHDCWAIPYSGGKDSGATLSFVLWAISGGLVRRPRKLLVMRSDTRLELPELCRNAEALMAEARRQGFDAVTVGPDEADGFYVQILGRGLPPAHPSYKGRWCTRLLKVKPMKAVLDRVGVEMGGAKFLLMSGVRLGESDRRDKLLNDSKAVAYAACSKDSGECGAGGIWMDERMSDAYTALPLIVNWRECHVYDWLQGWFTIDGRKGHGLEKLTRPIAWMYGQEADGRIERSMRFGCVGCPVVTKDRMTEQASKTQPQLAPILELHAIWADMRRHEHRLWKPSKSAKGKVGPLTIAARRRFFAQVMDVQHRSGVELMTPADVALIESHWSAGTHPRGWTGDEQIASTVARGDERSLFIAEPRGAA